MIFDGVASLMPGVFGAPILYIKAGRHPVTIQSRLRHEPIEIQQAEGPPILSTSPTWAVPQDQVPQIARGDTVMDQSGRRYTIQSVHPSGSPARDATVVCVLLERDSQESGL